MDRDSSLAGPPLSVDRILRQATPAAASELAPRHGTSWPGSICVAPSRWVGAGTTARIASSRFASTTRAANGIVLSAAVRSAPTGWNERHETLVPNTEYLQIVFTIPATLAELFLDNPAVTYNLLMQTAWRELKKFLEEIGVEAGAIVVLQTWNQRLGHHPHLHVLIPAGGISRDGKRWITIDQHPSLAAGNQWELGRKFRDCNLPQADAAAR